MVIVEEISMTEIEPLVRFAFFGDYDLINKYHIVNGEFDHCVKATIWAIEDVNKEYGLRYYKILLDGIRIGYMTLGVDFLHSFGINMRYRKKEVLKEWWSVLLSIMSDFFCTLHSKNTRAIEFLKKQGMTVHSEGENLINLITCL